MTINNFHGRIESKRFPIERNEQGGPHYPYDKCTEEWRAEGRSLKGSLCHHDGVNVWCSLPKETSP